MRILSYLLKVVLTICLLVIAYAWTTDCKDTAGVYVYCFPGDGR